MITAGIDCGSKTTKVVILKDGKIAGWSLLLSGFDQEATVRETFALALKKAELKESDVKRVIATGAGMKEVPFADDTITEVGADARGAIFLFPKARTVIDVGAEEGRAIRIDQNGKVIDFATNEKCAAGAGAFTEAMARALEVELEEFGRLSLKSNKAVPMNAQCTVFAESEVVSLIHAKTPKQDIARAIHDAIADRITSMVRRVGIEEDVILIGGVAKNVGFVDAMKRDLKVDLFIPKEPELVSALGAALAGEK
jgi:benzoyl-CoA reductase subunit D